MLTVIKSHSDKITDKNSLSVNELAKQSTRLPEYPTEMCISTVLFLDLKHFNTTEGKKISQ